MADWVPRIVGGTDLEVSANTNLAPPPDITMDMILNPSEDLVVSSYSAICERINQTPSDAGLSWEYGPKVRIADISGDPIEGQFIVESHGDTKLRTYWVPN